ncbi:hypothetical protein BGP_1700 [Beggiatoa sp. PS]|nr:hypothetical protein BGP_1700 [Beggiatoa sp. PS]
MLIVLLVLTLRQRNPSWDTLVSLSIKSIILNVQVFGKEAIFFLGLVILNEVRNDNQKINEFKKKT